MKGEKVTFNRHSYRTIEFRSTWRRGSSRGAGRSTRRTVVGERVPRARLLGSAEIAQNPSKYGVKCVLGANEEVGEENKSKFTPLTFRPDFSYNMR